MLVCVVPVASLATNAPSSSSPETVRSVGKAETNKPAYAVYRSGQAEDYLPETKSKLSKRPAARKRKPHSRPSFSLPEGFFVVALPIFFAIFLVVLIDMLKEMKDSDDGDRL